MVDFEGYIAHCNVDKSSGLLSFYVFSTPVIIRMIVFLLRRCLHCYIYHILYNKLSFCLGYRRKERNRPRRERQREKSQVTQEWSVG
ncbi:hypothetical protein VNO77_23798 [Canavalia gladiata]|uniref:Uncharacterized protein n=1 Tax=Canavalia gladiata TaxID=3824 RepID=A0AAN9QFM7_CANGL